MAEVRNVEKHLPDLITQCNFITLFSRGKAFYYSTHINASIHSLSIVFDQFLMLLVWATVTVTAALAAPFSPQPPPNTL